MLVVEVITFIVFTFFLWLLWHNNMKLQKQVEWMGAWVGEKETKICSLMGFKDDTMYVVRGLRERITSLEKPRDRVCKEGMALGTSDRPPLGADGKIEMLLNYLDLDIAPGEITPPRIVKKKK